MLNCFLKAFMTFEEMETDAEKNIPIGRLLLGYNFEGTLYHEQVERAS
jgi:hypothetical protein